MKKEYINLSDDSEDGLSSFLDANAPKKQKTNDQDEQLPSTKRLLQRC